MAGISRQLLRDLASFVILEHREGTPKALGAKALPAPPSRCLKEACAGRLTEQLRAAGRGPPALGVQRAGHYRESLLSLVPVNCFYLQMIPFSVLFFVTGFS